jgi:membrane associated rhomboid family serine protease
MELNHLFLFTAIASSIIVFAQSFRVRDVRMRLAAALVLIVSAVSWLLAPPIAGWIGGIAWCALLFVPACLRRRRRAARAPFYRSRRPTITFSPVVLTLVIVDVAVFLIEIIFGGPTNPRTLSRLGWLDTDWVIYGHQYWRLLTALFLHYGALHLVVNMFALLVLGPPLEREVGPANFAASYLLSGVGSSIVVVLLTRWGMLQAVELVGASGCIMGIVGAWSGFLLRNRDAPLAMRRLRNLVMIVLLQTVFDVLTPRVSMSAHLGGLACGFLLGLMIPLRPTAAASRRPARAR